MTRASIAALSLVLLAGCGGTASSPTTTVHRTWPAAELRGVVLYASSGDVEVSAGTDISVTATIRQRGRDARTEIVLFEVRDGKLTIREKRLRRSRIAWLPFLGKPAPKISYQLSIPPALPLTVTNVNGAIRSDGVGGRLRFETVNGSVSARNIKGKMDASTINGKVFVGYSGEFEGASLSSVNGSISIELPSDASFHTDISQVNGSFRSNVPMSFGAEGSSGVNGGKHALELSTINGSIEVVQRARAVAESPAPSPIAE